MDHAPRKRQAEFRYYEELNDFLPADRRKRAFTYEFTGTPSVKDAIEAMGIPHTAVDLILADGVSVGFDARLNGGERIAVYPVLSAWTFRRSTICGQHPFASRDSFWTRISEN